MKSARHILEHSKKSVTRDWCNQTAASANALQSCPALCDPIDGAPIPGILQARTLEWVAISFSNAWKWKVKVKSLSRCLTLCDPVHCSLPGSSVHGIFQARVLEWGAIAFSRCNHTSVSKSSLYSYSYSHITTWSMLWQTRCNGARLKTRDKLMRPM